MKTLQMIKTEWMCHATGDDDSEAKSVRDEDGDGEVEWKKE